MPSNQRIRGNNAFGLTTDNPLTAGATSFNSAGLANLPTIATQHAIVTLDPLRQFGEPEIVIVTAHTGAATVATISRAAYGTVARSHPQNTLWVHAPVIDDYQLIVTSGTRPSDPYEGQQIYETDTHRPGHRDNTQWLPGGPTSVVTVATRPANPYEGQFIYETDTNKLVGYGGVDWAPRDAGGTLGYASSSTAQGPITTEVDSTGMSIVVTVGTGRRIRITSRENFSSSAATGMYLLIKEGATEVGRVAGTGVVGTETTLIGSTILTPSAGSHTYKHTAQATGGSISRANVTASPCFILVEDIGAV